MYELPTSLEIDGINYGIRSDFRVILDIFRAFEDEELDKSEKWQVAIQILFIDWEDIMNYEEAIEKASWFINCGRKPIDKITPKRIDWEQDFQYIIAPINTMFRGKSNDIRLEEYVHWWTFMGYFNEIGESTLSTIVGIREKIRKGKKLDKHEQEFYDESPEIVNFEMNSDSLELLEMLRN